MKRRILIGVIASLCVLAMNARFDGDSTMHRGPAANTSTDGRFHTCGLVTENGVTEHLSEYHKRCG